MFRKDWFVMLVLALAILVADLTDLLPVRWIDGYLYDTSQGLKEKHAYQATRVALIDLDGGTPAERRLNATQLIERLRPAKASSIALLLPLNQAQHDPAIPLLDNMHTYIDAARLPRKAASRLDDMIVEAERRLDVDASLHRAIKHAGNVVLSAYPAADPAHGKEAAAGQGLSASIEALLDPHHDLIPPASGRSTSPLPGLADAAADVAPLALLRDDDGVVRAMPLWWQEQDGKSEPTLPLVLAARALGRTPQEVHAPRQPDFYPSYYGERGGNPVFAHYTASDVLAGKVPVTAFKRRIVLVEPTTDADFASPLGTRLDASRHVAQSVVSILNQDMYRRPAALAWSELATFGVLTLLLAFVLPRLGMTLFSITSLLLLFGLLGVEQYLLLSKQIWLQIGAPLTLLIAAYPILGIRRLYRSQHMKNLADSAYSNRQLGLALQEQGKLEMALERFQKLPASNDNLGLLYNLALDFERKRKFNTAEAVYQHILQQQPNFRDVTSRLAQARSMAKSAVLGTDRFLTSSGNMLVLEGGEKPMLGRYVIEKELGKGAMGAVYLGHDPKIGRTVAIKTLALAREFEGEEAQEAESRFFHEASAAGRLNHPNIVTIYDAAEEHDLAYIAMEYITGTPLIQYTKKDRLLPIATVLEIGMQAADALDYAHGQGIVHRDIKPANLMYNKDSRTIKVTDFGIARITSSGQTKTGTILGTPSFMSPEQMGGRPVDGRSDIFSLGVTLFVLLTGQKPFNGDSLAAISYQVVNDKHPDITTLRPELAPGIKRIVDKAMQKNPDSRYQDGKAMKRAIQRCLKDVEEAA